MPRLLRCLTASFGVLAAPAMAAMTLSSSDFKSGDAIPAAQVYPRCGGENLSPQLTWAGAPSGTESYVLTMIDTSVKPAHWSHWIVVDLPPEATSLVRGAKSLPGRARAIPSNFGDPYYDGPCPPDGSGVHQYQITIWALGTSRPPIVPDMPAAELEGMLSRVALDYASLTGTVKR